MRVMCDSYVVDAVDTDMAHVNEIERLQKKMKKERTKAESRSKYYQIVTIIMHSYFSHFFLSFHLLTDVDLTNTATQSAGVSKSSRRKTRH